MVKRREGNKETPISVSEKEVFIAVTNTALKKEYTKRIKIRPFVTDTAHVSVKYGVTIPTVQYGGARVDVMISSPCYVEEIRDVYSQVQEMAEELIDEEVAAIKEGIEDNG